MNNLDWQRSKTPSTVTVVCENNGRKLEADVLNLNEKVLVAAVSGVKVTLVSAKENGVYEGRMAGLDLVYVRS